MTSNHTKKSLEKHSLAPHKRFGQNFLVNSNTARAIVDCGSISPQDTIVEVGVGLGALTNIIAEKAKKVIGVEIDSGLIRYHNEEKSLGNNVHLIHDDILKSDFSSLAEMSGGPLKIMANLPYSISNPFIFKLIDNRTHLNWVVVMLQKEVADRLEAAPSTKQYGIPTILLGAYASVKKLLVVKPHEFHPQPKVDSLVIRIDFNNTNDEIAQFSQEEHKLFQQIVRVSFAKRRKTLLNNLTSLNISGSKADRKTMKENAQKLLSAAHINPQERAENLSITQFTTLTKTAGQLFSM